jgi:thiol:disulfide interchange protein DsbD
MAYLMFLVGLNLSGVFEVGRTLISVAGKATLSEGSVGSFGTGMLAAAVATPCTAPFMGTAMGFALTQTTTLASVSIFAALGFGMALPFVMLSFLPGLGATLPRPGPWMERFKQLLAFPMYATSVWLIWVLSQQTGSAGVLVALSGLVLLGFAGWLFNAIRNVESGWQYAGALIVLFSIFAALAIVRFPADEPSGIELAGTSPATGALSGELYSLRRLEELRADGRAVFVNFTAAWCIICLVNERVALNGVELAERFKQDNVAYLKGDWTNRDPNITKALARYGRNGVPLYLLYGPAGRSPDNATVLPQILTEATLLSALDDVKVASEATSAAELDLP